MEQVGLAVPAAANQRHAVRIVAGGGIGACLKCCQGCHPRKARLQELAPPHVVIPVVSWNLCGLESALSTGYHTGHVGSSAPRLRTVSSLPVSPTRIARRLDDRLLTQLSED